MEIEEIKSKAKEFIQNLVQNSKGEEMVQNEKVDKRDIIRQIMAIAGKEEASEDVKTIAKLAEKLAYDESEAGTSDNCKKAKNADEEEKEEKFEEEKEIAENKKAKNEENEEDDKEEEKADNKCAKNSMDDVKAMVLGGSTELKIGYISKAQRLELGNKY